MAIFFTSLILVGVSVGASPAPATPSADLPDPPPIVRHQLDEAASKRAAYEAFRQAGEAGTKSWASAPDPAMIDVLNYELDLHVDPTQQVLSGAVTVELAAVVDGLGTVELDADLGLRVLSVMQLTDEHFPYDTPRALVFEHRDNRLSIVLARALAAGEKLRLLVSYGGHASRRGLIGSTGVNWRSNGPTPVIHTFAQPFGARVWWPCNDRPDDKATVTMRMTVPQGLDIASNGLERSKIDNGDGTETSVWSSVYAVPTYLVVMHISDFAYSELTYTGLDGTTMPVALWAMPPVAAQAEADLAVTPAQIEVMAGHWGEYPFIEEKYGNATVFFGGGMEHQTMTTLSVNAVGDPWMQWLNVHELGHQWWGDWVTMDDWRHIWLNEGFATHTEWLWAEHLGPEVLEQYLVDEDYLGQFSGSVYDNPEPFSWTIYAKGSWVAWMLRHVIGDAAFFQAVAAYRAEHAGGTATTDDLESAMEAAGGVELDWFFDQWVYAPNRPRYLYSWQAVNGPAVELTVAQTQTNAGLFRMPVDVRVTTASGVEDHRVWFEAETEQVLEIPLQSHAVAVEIDPDNRVLCEIAHVSEPDLDFGPDFPDGFDAGLILTSGSATITVPLTNLGGADLVIEGYGTPWNAFDFRPPPELPLTLAPGETEELTIAFDPAGPGPQSGWFSILSNDPDRDGVAYFRVSGAGALYSQGLLVAPATTSAGRVPLGGTGECNFTLLNLGGQPVAVTTTVEGEEFALAKTVPQVIAPASSHEVAVRFHPTAVGPASGRVIFHAGDPANPLETVALSGTGESAPRLELSPAALALGIGDGTATELLTAANSGTEDLTVSVIAVGPPFTLTNPGALPTVIPAGSSARFEIGLEAALPGTMSGHLTVHSNDPSIPVALVPLTAHVTDDPVVTASFPGAARGVGVGGAQWSSTAFLLNPGDDNLQVDLTFRPSGERESGGPDVGFEIPARSQRVIGDLVGATGGSGTGGVNLRSSGGQLVAVSRTFASGADGTYGQLIAATNHSRALTGSGRYLLAGLAGNGGFHTNVGVLNLGAEILKVDLWFFDSAGELVGTRRVTAQPGAFAQTVAVISRLTGEIIRGGYATLTAVDGDARFLAYASVVDDASHDPTLVLPQELEVDNPGVDQVIPIAASTPGVAGTTWRSELTVVNAAAEQRSVTIEYNPVGSSSVTSMPVELAPGATLHFDDVVGGLFGATGKGWIRVSASGAGIHAASRTYNDDPTGTYGQLIPAVPIDRTTGPGQRALLPGLTSAAGFRTNIGITSLAASATMCTFAAFDNSGSPLGEVEIEIPAAAVVQVESILVDELGFEGFAWAAVSSDNADAAFLAHASVIDEATGDPTYIPAAVEAGGR